MFATTGRPVPAGAGGKGGQLVPACSLPLVPACSRYWFQLVPLPGSSLWSAKTARSRKRRPGRGGTHRACSLLVPACSLLVPACSLLVPACSLLVPACSLLVPACSLHPERSPQNGFNWPFSRSPQCPQCPIVPVTQTLGSRDMGQGEFRTLLRYPPTPRRRPVWYPAPSPAASQAE